MLQFSHLPLIALAFAFTSCSLTKPVSETAPLGPDVLDADAQALAKTGTVSFKDHVAPILQSRCLPCHDGKTIPGLFSLTSRTSAFQPGPLGPRIVPGEPDKSLLFLNPRGTHSSVSVMPPVGNRLTSNDLTVLRRWIAQGAEWPSGPAGKLSAPVE